ncbi:DUF6397 family protein [Streptomyces sp. TRM68416]|uniref:DUF6397 family protein n=1 Tax=Streptomyces sp. TRM68416 TaxID=2758412 RepID=UPI001662055D|nr:DUF6397 family protein [Streptomyces sp. TRM68416]MBD0840690.1 hypothetical protein [Streptomyces sp. TRM68416]
MPGDTITQPRQHTFSAGRAARELGLKRREFDLAVHLGLIRTVPDEGGGGRRVTGAEIERLRSGPGHPEALRGRVRAVGTTEGSDLMEISSGRFARLARLGLLVPVDFYLNRYRTVVWLYLAEELRQFASDEENARLLKARTPEELRDRLAAGLDLRPRNWRGRHLGFLLRQADDPWQQAGAVAAFLDPVQIAEIVTDPYERSHLHRFRPRPPAHGAPGSPASHLAEQLMTADDPDEIGWLRADLARAVQEARAHRPAPRPAPRRTPGPARRTTPGSDAAHRTVPVLDPVHRTVPALDPTRRTTQASDRAHPVPPTHGEPRTRRLLGWLRRRNA